MTFCGGLAKTPGGMRAGKRPLSTLWTGAGDSYSGVTTRLWPWLSAQCHWVLTPNPPMMKAKPTIRFQLPSALIGISPFVT